MKSSPHPIPSVLWGKLHLVRTPSRHDPNHWWPILECRGGAPSSSPWGVGGGEEGGGRRGKESQQNVFCPQYICMGHVTLFMCIPAMFCFKICLWEQMVLHATTRENFRCYVVDFLRIA